MADIRPFPAIRPAKGKEEEIAALPYDVYSRAEAREAVKDRPLSFLRIDRAETQLPEDVDLYDSRVYEKGEGAALGHGGARETLSRTSAPCYYLYELTMNGRSQTGIVACASVDDYLENRIKKHENTRREKEEDRVRHVDVCDAQTGPIFLAYRREETLKRLTAQEKQKEPLFDFVSEDGIRHRGWKIAGSAGDPGDPPAFQRMDALYIADGHHRAASAVRVGVKTQGRASRLYGGGGV